MIHIGRTICVVVLSLLPSEQVFSQNRVCRFHPQEIASRESQRTKEDIDQVVYIPVVFHIVYNDVEQNISFQQIYSQLNVLNEDFNRKNPDSVNTLEVFKSAAAKCNIRFFLAQEDELGNPSTGITRTFTNHGPFADDNIHYTSEGGANAWDAKKYLNIWVCNLADGVFGYASPPGSNVETDGVVIDYQFVGTTGTVVSPYNKGRTATHEVGHWLGLQHLWGSVGGCVDDDGIIDTPDQSGPTTGCDLISETCGSLNMVQNYMDHSYDECMNLFTKGQKAVMRNNLFLYRSGSIIENPVITSADREEVEGIEILLEGINTIHVRATHPIEEIKVIDMLGKEIPVVINRSSISDYYIHDNSNAKLLILIIKCGSRIAVKKVGLAD